MTVSNSSEYFRAREQQERTLASTASSPLVAKIHVEMAERYASLSREALPDPRIRSILRASV